MLQLCLLCLLAPNTLIADSRRVAKSARHIAAAEEQPEAKASEEWFFKEFPMCNPFSAVSNKSYRFDIKYTDQNCTDGGCMAIEFVRHAETPYLEIHDGQQWRATPRIGSEDWGGWVQWTLNAPCKDCHREVNKIVNLTDVKAIIFAAGGDNEPEELQVVTMPDEKGHER